MVKALGLRFLPMTYRMSKSERLARERLVYHMWMADIEDVDLSDWMVQLIPQAWHTLAEDIDCFESKEKVTLYLDKSVARSFKSMGKGYQARINRLLQMWLQMQAAGYLDRQTELKRRAIEVMKRGQKAADEGEEVPIAGATDDRWPREEPPDVDW